MEELSKVEQKNKIENFEEFSKLIKGRDILKTENVLNEIKNNSAENNLREVSDLLLSNKKLINNSTILRGETFNGQGIGQAILKGSMEEPLVQVVVVKGYNEPVNIFKNEWEFIPLESNKENYNRTVLHELLHSFTRYIISVYENNKKELLNDIEKIFMKIFLVYTKTFLIKIQPEINIWTK